MRRVTSPSRSVRRAVLSLAALASLGVAVAACSGGHGGSLKPYIVAPKEGASDGGLTVLIVGSNFSGPAGVKFDGIPGTNTHVVDEHHISTVTPPHAVGIVDVEVSNGGKSFRKLNGFEFILDHEAEPQTQMGFNDDFANYQRIPLDFDFPAYIGQQGDVDVLHLHTPFDGKVTLTFSWQASYNSGGLAGINVEFFHGPDPTPNPDSYAGGTLVATAVSGSASTTWVRMSYVQDGHGPFLRISGVGDGGLHAGFDPQHPYIIHAHFDADTSIEPGNAQDSFFQAKAIPAPVSGVSDIADVANYDQDYDWYTFSAGADGWARVRLNASGFSTSTAQSAASVSASLYMLDPADATHLINMNGASATAGASPAPEDAIFEAGGLQAQHTYFLRLYNQDNSSVPPALPFTYHALFEHGDGSFEALQPGGDLPAEVETSANAIAPAVGTPVVKTDYVFHYADQDWFKVTPANGTTLTVTWDHTAVRTALGDYDAATNPLGVSFGMLAFDQSWFDYLGHAASPEETIPAVHVLGSENFNGTTNTFTSAVNTHSLTFSVSAGQNYYVLLSALHGFDTADAYTVTFTVN